MSIEAFVRKNQGQSNYELMKRRAAELIAARDLPAAAERMRLTRDADFVYLPLLDLRCRVRIADGFAECAGAEGAPFREADFNTAMVLYDLLGYADPAARPTGDYSRLENFSRVQNAASYAGEGAFADSARLFDREFVRLRPALEAMGGVPWGKGDLSYRLPLFRELGMVLSFWRSDEEFPASLGLLFDGSILRYMHYETMWYAAGLCIRRITAHFSV